MRKPYDSSMSLVEGLIPLPPPPMPPSPYVPSSPPLPPLSPRAKSAMMVHFTRLSIQVDEEAGVAQISRILGTMVGGGEHLELVASAVRNEAGLWVGMGGRGQPFGPRYYSTPAPIGWDAVIARSMSKAEITAVKVAGKVGGKSNGKA